MAQFFRLKYGYETVLFYLAFFLGMLFLNFTMDRGEPFSLALLAAGLVCGLPALPSAGLCLVAGAACLPEGWIAFLAHAAAAVIMGGAFFFLQRRTQPLKALPPVALAAALIPYLCLYGQLIYHDYIRSALIAAVIGVVCLRVVFYISGVHLFMFY